MEINPTPNKLEEVIYESLRNYDARYDSGDWSRIDRTLDATTKSSVNKNYSTIAIAIGAVVLIAGSLIYVGINSTKTPEIPSKTTLEKASEKTIIPAEKKIKPVEKPVAVPVVPESTTPIAPVIEKQATIKEEPVPVVKPEEKIVVPVEKPKEKVVLDKSKNDSEEKVRDLYNTKPKEKEIKKNAPKPKGTTTIGLSGLLNLNADSIRKQQEAIQKDTLK